MKKVPFVRSWLVDYDVGQIPVCQNKICAPNEVAKCSLYGLLKNNLSKGEAEIYLFRAL